MQDQVMKFDPATGAPQPYPSHAEQWRRWFGLDCAWLFNPWSGDRRNAFDVGSDLNGRLIVAPETLGNDMGVAARLQNTANDKGEQTPACGRSARTPGCAAGGDE